MQTCHMVWKSCCNQAHEDHVRQHISPKDCSALVELIPWSIDCCLNPSMYLHWIDRWRWRRTWTSLRGTNYLRYVGVSEEGPSWFYTRRETLCWNRVPSTTPPRDRVSFMFYNAVVLDSFKSSNLIIKVRISFYLIKGHCIPVLLGT